MIKPQRALISVSDKAGLVDFTRGLVDHGVEIISTGGTARHLRDAKIPVKDVSDITHFPEILDGRVKTLHPAVHGGLLAVRENQKHLKQLEEHDIGLIDMVVVNLYPFEKVIAKKKVDLEEAIENIDIGGPTMLRSAAKNYKSVAVVCNPQRYKQILEEMRTNRGILPDGLLMQLAKEVFERTSNYDRIINDFLGKRFESPDFSEFSKEVSLHFSKVQDLRYGENPHQSAAFYADSDSVFGLGKLKQLHGKELSYNNILDLHAAVDVVKDFNKPAAVIIKHNNPTGVCEDDALDIAFQKAHLCDTLSAFGGIIGLNKKVDSKTAIAISKSGFMECIIAPGFDAQAQKILKKKKNVRLVQVNLKELKKEKFDYKRVYGGLLLQDKDVKQVSLKDLKIVSKKKPTQIQLESMLFGWKVIKHVKSNAIALVKGNQTVGLGVGQTSRVDSAIIAIRKAGAKAKGSLLISDAFLPKSDTVTVAAKAGIKAIIQTGGSIMDEEVIKEADRCKIVMAMAGARHFKH